MAEHKIVYCNCTYARIIEKDVKQAVLQALSETGVAFTAVPDLCEMAAQKDPELARLMSTGPVKLAACYKRAVKGLCHSSGVTWNDDDIEVINMRETDAEGVVKALLNTEALS